MTSSPSPRRVALISVHTSPLAQPGTGDAGGMNVYVWTATRLARRGDEVEIFTRATSSADPASVAAAPGVTVRHVVAPQALRIALPPLGNDLIDLVKGTSLVMVITLADVFQVGRQIAATNFQPLALYAEVAVIYLAIFTVLSLLQSRLERVSNRYIRSSHA